MNNRYIPVILWIGLLLTCFQSNAQVAAYLFTSRDSVYTEISGANVLGDTTSEDQYFVDTSIPLGGTVRTGPGLPIGFTFMYNGFAYDVFGVSTNGWIGLGNGSVDLNSASNYFPLSSLTGGNFMAVFARNLQAQDSASIEYLTTGTAPDRQLIVQWKNYRKHLNVNDHYNFQIHLYETSNKIEYFYGDVITNINATFVSVGFIGSDSTDFNVRTTTGSGGWTATSAGVSNSATCTLNPSEFPPNGLVFRWEAPEPCTAPPVAGNTTTSFSSVCANSPFILTIANYSSGPGQSYQWQSSPDSSVWTDITGANTTAYSTTQVAAAWYRCELTCSGQSSTSVPVFVEFNPPTLCYCNQNLGGDCAGYGYIDTVLIFNTSIANMHSGCDNLTAPNYSDFPPTAGRTGTFYRGSSYMISVTCTFEANISLWIDYNQSGSFDANEWTQVSAHALINVPSVVNFTVPATAIPGTTKMRLRTRINGAANGATDACTQFLSGETEDYTITIDYGVGVNNPFIIGDNFLIYPNPAFSEVSVKWMSEMSGCRLRLLDLNGQIARELDIQKVTTSQLTSFDVSNLSAGIYFLQVISGNGIETEKIMIGK